MKPFVVGKRLGIPAYMVIGTTIICLVAGVFLVRRVYSTLRTEAIDDARSEALLVSSRIHAYHEFFAKELRPHLHDLIKKSQVQEIPFDPMAMSSSFTNSEINRYWEKTAGSRYHYKQAAVNARNPANEANVVERRYLEAVRNDPRRTTIEELVDVDGEPVFISAGMFRFMEESCLQCHGDPDDAPTDLLRLYGRERGFHWPLGQPVGVGVVTVSMAEPFADAKNAALSLSLALMVILGCALWGQWLMLKRLVITPLRTVEATIDGPDPVKNLAGFAEDWLVPREIDSLLCALRNLSRSELEHNRYLEEAVASRTEKLADLNQELISKNAEMERFVYTVSHDLKSPLITIQGFLGMVKEGLPPDTPQQLHEDLAQINQASYKMYELLEGLLELSRVGRVVSPSEYISLNDVVHEALQLVRRSGIDFVVADQLPKVFGDRIRLREVFQNLLENAIKYSLEQPRPRIEIGAAVLDGKLACFVRDNGCGIDPAYQGRVFDLFEKLDADSAGSGIGLALVKRIVELHDGRVWIESAGPGTGTTVCLRFPWVENGRQDGEA